MHKILNRKFPFIVMIIRSGLFVFSLPFYLWRLLIIFYYSFFFTHSVPSVNVSKNKRKENISIEYGVDGLFSLQRLTAFQSVAWWFLRLHVHLPHHRKIYINILELTWNFNDSTFLLKWRIATAGKMSKKMKKENRDWNERRMHLSAMHSKLKHRKTQTNKMENGGKRIQTFYVECVYDVQLLTSFFSSIFSLHFLHFHSNMNFEYAKRKNDWHQSCVHSIHSIFVFLHSSIHFFLQSKIETFKFSIFWKIFRPNSAILWLVNSFMVCLFFSLFGVIISQRISRKNPILT